MNSVMRFPLCVVTIVLFACAAGSLAAQEPAPQPGAPRSPREPQPVPAPQAPQPAPAPPSPRAAPAPRTAQDRQPQGRPVNLQVELTISDQVESEPAQKKTVSMIVADRAFGRVRASGQTQIATIGFVPVQLNVDARPAIQANDSIRLELTLEYRPSPPSTTDGKDAARPSSALNESLTVILQSGKPLTVSRAVDPFTNRRTSVDVTATIMK